MKKEEEFFGGRSKEILKEPGLLAFMKDTNQKLGSIQEQLRQYRKHTHPSLLASQCPLLSLFILL